MIEKLTFGRTGHLSTRTLFGAAAYYDVTQEAADAAFEVVLEYGINHIDTAASYGKAEERLGPLLAQHGDRFFLATKTEERTAEGAWAELQRSFERMGVDSVDLWQMHFLVDPDEWATAMGPGGALEAFVRAKEEGLVRYLGVTGHEVSVAAMHLKSLERYDFDSVLLPYNYAMMQNPQYAADFEELYAVCQERNVAVQTIKSLARGRWQDRAQATHATWYQPYSEQEQIDLLVWWVLSRPGVFLNTSADVTLLPKIFDAASRFEPGMDQAALGEQIAALEPEPLFT